MKRKAFLSLILASLILVAAFPRLPAPVHAAEAIRNTLNIAEATKNERGPGYEWANRTKVLTLDGLQIITDDAYGLRLPKITTEVVPTVILKGDNYIKAAKYGISFSGTITFKGSGSLTIDAGEIGLYLISQDDTQKVRLLEGTYKITAGTYGIYSESSDFSFTGDRMDVTVKSNDGLAISGRIVNLLGGSFSANAPVSASHALTVQGLDLSIIAGSEALSAKNLTIKDIHFTEGEKIDGENTVIGYSTASRERASVIFGDSVPGYVDVILLAVAILGVTAAILGPILLRRRKRRTLYERLEREGFKTPEQFSPVPSKAGQTNLKTSGKGKA